MVNTYSYTLFFVVNASQAAASLVEALVIVAQNPVHHLGNVPPGRLGAVDSECTATRAKPVAAVGAVVVAWEVAAAAYAVEVAAVVTL